MAFLYDFTCVKCLKHVNETHPSGSEPYVCHSCASDMRNEKLNKYLAEQMSVPTEEQLKRIWTYIFKHNENHPQIERFY